MAELNEHGEVRAAGGVVVRGGEVLVVHRPKYDDWSLPKGKAEPGEPDEACALREVEEETGLVCELGDELGTVRYRDRLDRPKAVRYWEMRPVSGAFEPTGEVDEIRWIRPADALRVLTYAHDGEVLAPYVRHTRLT